MEEEYYDAHSNSKLKGMLPTAMSSFFSAYAPFAGYMFMLKSMSTNFLPYEFQSYVHSYLKSSLSYLMDPLANHITLLVEKKPCDSDGLSQRNLVYEAAEVYLATMINPKTQIFRISKAPRQKVPIIAVTTNQDITDTFENISVKWRMIFPEEKDRHSHYSRDNKCRIELTFHRKHRDKVTSSYIPYVLSQAEAIINAEKTLKLSSYNSKRSYRTHHHHGHSDGSDGEDDDDYSSGIWSCMDLEHPATFETIAMEPELKRMIVEDLDKFVKRKEFYKRVGKAWKRGYMLFGPPGTGKSSLIAAMANHLHFNIYDLELTGISSNDELRKALISTTNRSIVVFEDIDCTKESVNRESAENKFMVSKAKSKFTLWGLLNVIDGLWSSCGDERIIVFTTNHKERLDPALLRPGRMDMHIHMSYCTPGGFKTLASNYLGIRDTSENRLCGEIEGLIESTNITPAEVCEELMRGGGDDDETDVALEGLVNCLKRKRLETNKIEEE